MMVARKGYLAHLKEYLLIVCPIMISLLSFLFISLSDKLMIAQLGKEELVGASSVNLIVFVPILLSVGCCTILPPIVAAGEARKDYREGSEMLYALLVLCGLICGGFIFLFVGAPHFLLAKVSPGILEKVNGFFWTVCISAPFSIMLQPLRKYMEGLGWLRLNMVSSLLGGMGNIVLNYIFIYGFLRIPPMGVLGAGVATLIVRVVTFLLYVYFVFVMIRKRGKLLGLYFFREKANTRHLWNRLLLSFPGGLELFSQALLYSLLDRLLYRLYAHEVAIHAAGTILFDLIRYTGLVSLAAAITSTLLMGRVSAVGDKKDEMRIGLIGYSINGLLAVIGALLGLFFYPYMFWLMQWTSGAVEARMSSTATKELVGALIGYAGAVQIAGSFNTLGICLLRGRKDVFMPVLLSVVSLLLVSLPISFLLGLTYQMGIHGILLGLFLGNSVAALGLFARFAQGSFSLGK